MTSAHARQEQTRPGMARRGRIVAAGLLIAGAGVSLGWGLLLRWQRCLGGLESRECEIIQDHAYDYFLPSDPWISIPGAAQLAGLGYLLVVAGLVLGATRYLLTPAEKAFWWVQLGLLAVVGLFTLWSGLTAETLPLNQPLHFIWFFLGPVILGVAAVLITRGIVGKRIGWLFVAVLVVLALTSNELLEYIIFVIFYPSYDTPPWTGSIQAVLLSALGLAITATAIRQATTAEGRVRPR